jgi:hypothetical protein
MTSSHSHTVETILQSLGYPDPVTAARQQARMILLGRLARYQAARQQVASRWDMTPAQMKQQYEQEEQENFDLDDDYVQWQWYSDAIAAVEDQLAVLTTE